MQKKTMAKKPKPLPRSFKQKTPIGLQVLLEATRLFFTPETREISLAEIVEEAKERVLPPLQQDGVSLEILSNEVHHLKWTHVDVAITFSPTKATLCRASEPDQIVFIARSTVSMYVFLQGLKAAIHADGRPLHNSISTFGKDVNEYSFEYNVGTFRGKPHIMQSGVFFDAESADTWKLGYEAGQELYLARRAYLNRWRVK